MSFLWRWLKRLVLAIILLAVGLLAPVAYTEVACRGTPVADAYAPLVAPVHRRNEARTLLTYPEWAIVHAYDDYARVVEDGPPHAFAFSSAIRGFWSSLCPLARLAAQHGGFDGDTKTMIYTIGVSFTAEFLAKAAYEETLGRLAHGLWGRGVVDDLAAEQARAYARFLQQTPWYKWDFAGDAGALTAVTAATPRDRERQLALGVGYRAKAAYARAIANAVEGIGGDQLTLRMVMAPGYRTHA